MNLLTLTYSSCLWYLMNFIYVNMYMYSVFQTKLQLNDEYSKHEGTYTKGAQF